jgi:hypothetical protein
MACFSLMQLLMWFPHFIRNQTALPLQKTLAFSVYVAGRSRLKDPDQAKWLSRQTNSWVVE